MEQSGEPTQAPHPLGKTPKWVLIWAGLVVVAIVGAVAAHELEISVGTKDSGAKKATYICREQSGRVIPAVDRTECEQYWSGTYERSER